MSVAGSVGGWILYAVHPSALKRAASAAYASFDASTAAGVGRHAIAIGPEQPVDRQARHLARDVPQGDVHGADGPQRGLTVFLPHGLPQSLALERILSHHERFQIVDQ